MVNTNCSFLKFNDLMGIHRVVFDSLIDGKSFSESITDVKTNYLQRYYGNDLRGIGNDPDTVREMLSDVASAIYLATQVIEDSNQTDEVVTKIDIDNAQSQINTIVSGWQAEILSNAGVLATNNVETRNAEEERDATATSGDITPFRKEDILFNSNIIAEPLNTHVVTIKSPLDLVSNYYKAATMAKNKLTRGLYNDLFKASFIDLSDPNATPVITSKEVDTNVKKYKDRLFKELFPGEDLYENGITRTDLQERLSIVQMQLQQMNGGNGVYVQDLLRWAFLDSPELKKYNSFVSLKHFDDLVKMYGNGFVSVKPNLIGNYAESLKDIKYLPANMSNMRTAWNNNEIVSIAQETTAIFKTFVETTPIINLEGKRTNNFLKPDQVYYSLSKLKQKIDKSDVSTSAKLAIQDALEAHFNGTNKSLNNTDIKSLLTLYQRVFMDKDQNAKWMRNPNMAPIIRNIESIGENSLYSVYKTHFPGRNNLNLLEVISSAINKVDLMNYNEVSYDFGTKEFKSTSLQTKLNDRQFNGLKTLGSQSLNATTRSISNLSRDLDFQIDDDGISFNFGSTFVRYNVLEGTFVNSNDEPFNFQNINVPTNITDLMIEDYAADFPQYKKILDVVSALTGQPLTALNYEIPQVMNDNFGKSHIQDMLVIAGNAAYTSYLKANYLEDLNTMSTADIESALSRVPGLTYAIDFKKLWNARMGYFNIDFGDLSFQAIRNYADVLNEVYGSNIKSTTVNAEGNSVPTYTLSRMINDFNGVISLMRNSEHNYKMPLANNMFITNTNNDLLKKIEVRLNLKDSEGNVVSSGSLSEIERVTYDILNDYVEQKLQPIETDRNPKFQATNYSDKSSHAAIVINGNADIEINGVRKKYRNFKTDDYRQYFFQTQSSYFNNLWDTLKEDYTTLFESGALAKRYIDSTELLKLALNGIEPINGVDYDSLDPNYHGDKLRSEVQAYNRLYNTSNAFLNGKGNSLNIEEVNNILSDVNEKVLVTALGDAGINTVKVVSYEVDPTTKKPVVNRTLQYMLDSFDTGYRAFEKKLKKNFVQSLEDMGFSLDYLNINTLAENPLLTRASEQWDMESFKDEFLGRYKLYNGNLNGDFEMNPMLEQYLWEYNLNTQNFQNATVGTILGHPSKVKRGADESEESFNNKMVSARSIAMFKRMVIHQATFHPYNLNLINGINFYNRVSFIKDPSANVFSPYGTRDKVDVTDGSTFNSPLLTIQQNNSLLDQRAGWTQKSIGGGVNSKYNSAELLKHAAHSITNERLNNENSDAKFSWIGLIEKGHNMPFNINGIPVKVDITKDYNGQPINLENIFDDVAFYDSITDKYLSVNKIEKSPNWLTDNEYNVFYKDLLTDQILDPQAVRINSLFDLWQTLGGKNSISFQDGEYDHRLARPEKLKSYIPSNRSWEALAEYVNRVGTWNNDEAVSTLSSSGEFSARDIRDAYSQTVMNPLSNDSNYDNNTHSPNQKTIIQPLKQSFIGQYTFSSGQKVGVQNENDSIVLNSGNPTQLKFAIVSNMHTGVQLNSDHETDDSIVTEPTQITNTLPFNGDTPEYARRAYKAVYLYIDNSLSKILPDIDKTLESTDAKFRVYNVIANEIIRGLDGKDAPGMAGAIAMAVQNELDRYKEELKRIAQMEPTDPKHQEALTKLEQLDQDGFKLPFSDTNVYGNFSTTVANFFTKNGIRRKLPGMAAVISPYSGFAGLRTVVNPTTNKSSVVMESAYKAWRQNLIATGLDPATFETTAINDINKDLIEMYDTVIDPEGKQFYIDTPDLYYAVKGRTGEFKKLNTASRDLKPTTHKWQIDGNEGFTSYYDLPVTKLAFLNETIQNAYDDLFNIKKKMSGTLDDFGMSNYEAEKNGSSLEKFDSKAAKLQNLLTEYNNLIEYAGLESDIPQYEVKAERYGSNFDISILENGKPVKKLDVLFNDRTKRLMKNELSQLLQVVHTKKRAPMPISSLTVPGVLSKYQILVDFDDMLNTISAEEHYLDYIKEYPGTSIEQWYKEVKPMVRVDNLTTIPGEIMMPVVFKTKYGITANTNVSDIDQAFFQSKLDYNALPHTNSHDFYVRSLNGEHLYVLLEGSENYDKLDLREVKVDSISNKKEDGTVKTYKVDDNGDAQYELGYDKLYQSMIDGKMHNFVIVKTIDELQNLHSVTKGPNSSYKDIIPNFQAGIDVATLGVEYLNQSKNKNAQRFAKTLKAINNITNSVRGIRGAQATSEKLQKANEAALLSIYDKEWVTGEINSITKYLGQENAHRVDESNKLRAEQKLQHLVDYNLALENNDEAAIITQAAIFREGELQRANNRIQKLTQSLMKTDTATDQALREMANFMQTSLINRNEKFAKEMYSSFITQLNVTAARIPGQHMQSYMGQTVVGFVHSEENLAFVSPSHMWITGEDFDIDKAYISQYSVDDNGKLIGWSDMFNYDTPETLLKSLQLPIPDRKVKKYMTDGSGKITLLPKDANAILGYVNNKIGFDTYVDAMSKLDDASTVNISLIPTEQLKELQDHIDTYFLSDMNSRFPKEATLNILVASINGASNDIRNINAVFSPMTFGDAGEAAAKSKKGQGFNSVSPFNPVDIAKATNNNMVGRDVIGISASTGLKGYSALSNAFIQIMTDPDFDIHLTNKVYDYIQDDKGNVVKENERTVVGLAGINYTNSLDELVKYYERTFDQLGVSVAPEELAEVRETMREELRYRGDVALDLSSILSAATDNAKELILSRINAGPETVTFYLSGLMKGYSFNSMANLMTSKETEAMVTLASRNVYTGKRVTLDQAIKQLQEGVLRPRDYFDFKTIQVIVDQLRESTKLVEEIKATFDQTLPVQEIERALQNPYLFMEKAMKVMTRSDFNNLKIKNTAVIKGNYTTENYSIKRKSKAENEASLDNESADAVMQPELLDDNFNEGDQQEHNDTQDDERQDFGSDAEQDENRRPAKPSIINAEVAFNRYKEAVAKLLPTGLNQEIIKDLASFAETNKDFETLGKMLSINQAIKVTDYDLYKYFNNITKFMTDRYGMILYNTEDFNRFTSDPAFRQKVFDSYVGEGIDVLRVLYKSPHFSKMFELAVKTDVLKGNFSMKNRTVKNIVAMAEDSVGLNNINRKQFGNIAKFVDEVVIANFLESNDTVINLIEGDYDETNTPILANKTITLDTIEGREAFVNWFEKTVMNDLKAGRLRDTDNNYLQQPNANIRENMFIQQLQLDVRKDPFLKKNYNFYKLPINLNSNVTEDEKVLIDTITGAFAALRNEQYGGKKVLDLLYLYNLIVNKNRSNNQSFNSLFDAVSENFDNDSIMTKFVKFESEMDWNNAFLQSGEHYEMEDLALKGIVRVSVSAPIKRPDPLISPSFLATDDWNEERGEMVRTIHKLVGEDYIPIDPPKYSEKVLNVHNGMSSLSNIVLNNAHRIKLNRLNKLLENMEIEQLNCT